MIRILSILVIIQIFAVGSLQAGELTAPSKDIRKVGVYWAKKDYRGSAHYLCAALLAEYPNVDQELLTALSETYTRAGAVHRAEELTKIKEVRPVRPAKANENERTLQNFLYSEIAATKPNLSIIQEKNGDLLVKRDNEKQRFSFPDDGSEHITKNSVKYQQALQHFWWFKPRI